MWLSAYTGEAVVSIQGGERVRRGEECKLFWKKISLRNHLEFCFVFDPLEHSWDRTITVVLGLEDIGINKIAYLNSGHFVHIQEVTKPVVFTDGCNEKLILGIHENVKVSDVHFLLHLCSLTNTFSPNFKLYLLK